MRHLAYCVPSLHTRGTANLTSGSTIKRTGAAVSAYWGGRPRPRLNPRVKTQNAPAQGAPERTAFAACGTVLYTTERWE